MCGLRLLRLRLLSLPPLLLHQPLLHGIICLQLLPDLVL